MCGHSVTDARRTALDVLEDEIRGLHAELDDLFARDENPERRDEINRTLNLLCEQRDRLRRADETGSVALPHDLEGVERTETGFTATGDTWQESVDRLNAAACLNRLATIREVDDEGVETPANESIRRGVMQSATPGALRILRSHSSAPAPLAALRFGRARQAISARRSRSRRGTSHAAHGPPGRRTRPGRPGSDDDPHEPPDRPLGRLLRALARLLKRGGR